MISLKYCFVCLLFLYFQNGEGESTRTNAEASFIVNGRPADRPMPYQISYQRLWRGDWQHVCGGTIITLYHVLTAAQCFSDESTDSKSVLAGTWFLSSGGRRHDLDWIRKHPNYVGSYWFDIAILRIKGYFEWSESIKPIGFRNASIFPGDKLCWASGWGRLYPDTTLLPDHLHITEVKTMSNEECADYWQIDVTQICTQNWYGRGPCEGDTGGPLASIDQAVLVGIITHSPSNCVTGLPAVYTRVSWFVDWIRENLL